MALSSGHGCDKLNFADRDISAPTSGRCPATRNLQLPHSSLVVVISIADRSLDVEIGLRKALEILVLVALKDVPFLHLVAQPVVPFRQFMEFVVQLAASFAAIHCATEVARGIGKAFGVPSELMAQRVVVDIVVEIVRSPIEVSRRAGQFTG